MLRRVLGYLSFKPATHQSRRLNHSETYALLSTDREQDIQQCINEERGHFSNRLMVDTQYKVWGAVKHIKLMAESDRIRKLKGQRRKRRSKKRLLNPEHAMYMFFEKQGFNYNEVLANCEFFSSHHSMHQLRWAVLCMQVERKEMTMANLRARIKEETETDVTYQYPSTPLIVSAYAGGVPEKLLYNTLSTHGVCEQQLKQFKENTRGYRDGKSKNRTGSVVYRCEADIAKLMIRYLGTSPQSIIDEYRCLKYLSVEDLIDRMEDIKLIGYKSPHEVVNYLHMIYLPPYRRGVVTLTKSLLYHLLKITPEECKKRGMRGQLFNYLCTSSSIQAHDVKATIVYLQKELGFTIEDIGLVPAVVAFSKSSIEALMHDPPEPFADKYDSATNNTVKLNLLITQLDQANDYMLTSLDSQTSRSKYDLFKFNTGSPRKNFSLIY